MPTNLTPDEANKKRQDAYNAIEGMIGQLPGYVTEAQRAEMRAGMRAQFEQQIQSQYVDSTQNPDFVYRGDPNAAEADLARYRGYADLARSRPGIYADYANANQQRGNSLDARAQQQSALGLYQNMAEGKGPSVAQGMYQQNLDRGIQAGASLANSSRGGALALAQGRLAAQGQAANMMAGSSSQAAQLRAQEMQQAMAGYAGLASNIRAGDMQGQGADAQMAQQQASLGLQSRGLNDQTGLAYENMGQGVIGTASGLGLEREAALQRNVDQMNAQAAALRAQNNQHSAQTQQTFGQVASVVVPVAGAAVSAAGNAYANSNGSGAGSSIGNMAGGATTGGVNAASTTMGLSSDPSTPVVPVQPQQGTTLFDPNDPRWKRRGGL